MSERESMYRDILITAVEGGVNYWASVSEYKIKCDDETGEIVSVTATLADEDEDKEYAVDVATIRKGMSLLHKGGGHYRKPAPEWWVKKWRKAYRGCATGEWDYDACDADCVVQAGIFGEVVYG